MNVDVEMAGSYSCEVSADAPSFQTAIVTGSVDVVGKVFYHFNHKILIKVI